MRVLDHVEEHLGLVIATSPRRRRQLALVGVAAAVVSLVAVGLRVSGPAFDHKPSAEDLRSERTCAGSDAPEVCSDLTLDDGRLIRYALHGDAFSDQVVIVDLGGPGLSLFGDHWPQEFLTSIQPSLSGYRLLLLEEPWVTADYPEACRAALTEQYRWTRGEADQPESVADDCGLGAGAFGWTKGSYRAAVEAIVTRNDLDLVGFLSASFGSHRYGHVDDLVQWAIVTNPAATGLSLGAYLDGRATAVETVMRESCSAGCSDLDAMLSAAAEAGAGTSVDGRSVPLAVSDVGAAALAVPYQDQGTRTVLTDALLVGDDYALVGRASDGVWGRYGQWSISLRHAAYLDEICAAFSGRAPNGEGLVARALSDLHAPCADVSAPAAAAATAPAGGLCVAHLQDDPVTPPVFAHTWDAVATVNLELEGSGHSTLAGMERCIDQLGISG